MDGPSNDALGSAGGSDSNASDTVDSDTDTVDSDTDTVDPDTDTVDPDTDTVDSDTDTVDSDTVVAEWRERLPESTSLETRLGELGIDETTLRRHVAQTAWPATEPLPAWVDQLDEIARQVAGETPSLPAAVTVGDDRPFGPVVAAVAAVTTAQLPDGVDRDVVTPAVEWLLDRLSRLCERALYVEFRSFVTHHDPELATTDPEAVAEPPTAHYETFVDRMTGDAFPALCLEYPFLGRLVTTVTTQFQDVTTTLFDRIDADREGLCERFGVDGAVESVTPLANDTHQGGAVPFRVEFETGTVVYKPRSTAVGETLYAVLDRVGEQSGCPRVQTPTVWSRDGYGWVSHHEAAPATDEAAIRRYYRRAGCLVAVGHLLGLTDCHHENVLSEGEHPVVVDAETALSPGVPPADSPRSTSVAEFVEETVLSTALLPTDRMDPRGELPRIGAFAAGFGAASEQRAVDGETELAFRAVNTDLIRATERDQIIDRRDNTVTTDDGDHPPSAYADELTAGFEQGYETLVELAGGAVEATEGGLDASDGQLADLLAGLDEATRGRLIYRSTQSYRTLHREMVGIGPLSDGVRASVVWESLQEPFLDGSVESDRFRGLCSAERTALRRFDVPRFTVPAGGGAVRRDGSDTGVRLSESGHERVRRRIAAASPVDRRRQARLIRESVAASASTPAPPSAPNSSNTDDYRVVARRVFERVRDHCRDDTGEWDWVAVYADATGLSLEPPSDSLYHGRVGVAVAAAALARLHEGDQAERYRTDARELLAPVVTAVESDVSFRLGGTSGVGGVVYGLTVAADLLGAPRYRQAATELGASVDPAVLEADETFDVMHGAAGTALGLAAQFKRTGEEQLLSTAVACADRLREAAEPQSTGVGWRGPAGNLNTGFSHGTSGIACALARVGDLADTPRHRETAREAVAFEASQFDSDRQNWRSEIQGTTFPDRWCRGRSGILLARDEITDRLGGSPGAADHQQVAERIAADPPSEHDHLCCGTLGRAETLLAISDGDDRWQAAAQRLLAAPVARREQTGAFALQRGHGPHDPNPTLFDGLAGVTYGCLRATAPTVLPTVARLE